MEKKNEQLKKKIITPSIFVSSKLCSKMKIIKKPKIKHVFFYGKPHTKFFSPNYKYSNEDFNLIEKESVSIQLSPYKKENYKQNFDSYYFSKLQEFLTLFRGRNDKISMRSKKIRKYKTKKEIRNEKNEKIKQALKLHDLGYKNAYICNFLILKINELHYIIDKRKKGKPPIFEGKSRPTKIKLKYLIFLKDYYSNTNRIESVLSTKILLINNFPEIKEISYSTVRKIIKRAGFN